MRHLVTVLAAVAVITWLSAVVVYVHVLLEWPKGVLAMTAVQLMLFAVPLVALVWMVVGSMYLLSRGTQR